LKLLKVAADLSSMCSDHADQLAEERW